MPKNRFAQMLVEKYELGPKIATFLEQAGMRLAAGALRASYAGLLRGRIRGRLADAADRQAAGAGRWALAARLGPFCMCIFKRKSRLQTIRRDLSGCARIRFAIDARRPRVLGFARNDSSRISGAGVGRIPPHLRRSTTSGLPIEVALQKLAKRVPSLDVHFFVSAVLLQKRTGGNLAEILDKLAYVIRERFKLRGRIRAVSAHGKMTATALSCIPIAVAVLMFYTNPDYVKFFFTDDVGNIMLGAAVVLQLIGYGIMKKIVNIEV